MFDSSFVRFTPPPVERSVSSRVPLRAVNFSPRLVANQPRRIYILRVRPGRWRSSVDVDVVPRPRDLPRLRHFQQRTRDHLRGARVFDKPVKARPRICLPLAFVTLLVLWLDLELTWKKGPRWYPEQTVRVCPGSTRRTPLSATVACSPTGMRRTRRTTPDDTFHDTFARNRGKRGVSLAPLSLSLCLAYPLQ